MKELEERFFQYNKGVIPTTKVNWANQNSDVAFNANFNFLAVIMMYRVTGSDVSLKAMIDYCLLYTSPSPRDRG